MKQALVWTMIGLASLAAGCADGPILLRQPSPGGVVAAAADAVGGVDAWLSADPIVADVIVAVYDADGGPHANQHRQVIDVARGTIRAGATEADGRRWRAIAGVGRGAHFTAKPAAGKEDLALALGTLAHRVRGPLNLCGVDEPADEGRKVHLAGESLIRVGLRRSVGGGMAYYFDPETMFLKYLTAGGDAPGEEGTVTVYTYGKQANGMAFPTRLAIYRIGQHVLVGDEPVLTATFRRVHP